MNYSHEVVRAEEDPAVLLLDFVTEGRGYALVSIDKVTEDDQEGWQVFLQIGNGVDSLYLAKKVLELGLHSVNTALEQQSEPTSE